MTNYNNIDYRTLTLIIPDKKQKKKIQQRDFFQHWYEDRISTYQKFILESLYKRIPERCCIAKMENCGDILYYIMQLSNYQIYPTPYSSVRELIEQNLHKFNIFVIEEN